MSSDAVRPTRAECEAIISRSELATPGPWEAEFPTGRDAQWFDIVAGPNNEEIMHAETEPLLYWVHPSSKAAVLTATESRKANLEFVAHARTDLPELTRAYLALLDENAKLQKSGHWRVGGKIPLNVYEDDRPMFQCHTPEDAARVVALLNGNANLQRDKERTLTANEVLDEMDKFCAHAGAIVLRRDYQKTGTMAPAILTSLKLKAVTRYEREREAIDAAKEYK